MSTNPYNNDKRLIELLERWQSGDFSRADEQELLSLTDSDDFRRETVEGFLSMPEVDHAAHLEAIRAKLRQQNGGKKRVFLMPILAAAAVLLLILATVWLIPSTEKLAPIAQESAPQSVVDQPITSNLPEKGATDATPPPAYPKPQAPVGPSGSNARLASPQISEPDASTAASEQAITPPMPSRDEAVADKMSSKPVIVEGELAKVDLGEEDDVDVNPGNMAPKKKAEEDLAGRAKEAKKMKPGATENSSKPVGGWANFQDYLRQKARLPENARQNNISGSVRLSFRLNENSEPVDFKIVKSLGLGCDEEAIRLVKAYNWQRGNDPEIRLEIPFVR